MEKFEVNILGCGSAVPKGQHVTTAQLVNIHEKMYASERKDSKDDYVEVNGLTIDSTKKSSALVRN